MPLKKNRGIHERLIIITATALIMTLTLLGYYLNQYRVADKLYDEIASIAFEEDSTVSGESPARSSVNHAALTARNKDYIAWIKVDGTDISYPVVQSKEELYYLRRDFDKQHSIPGTVFMDYRNSKDFTDMHTMLFGHHMKDGSMFAPLKSFLKKDFFEKHKYIRISTPDKELVYEIFAVYEVRASSVPFSPGNLTQQALEELLETIKKQAINSREIALSGQENFLTLVTCGYSIKNARITVHAKLFAD